MALNKILVGGGIWKTEVILKDLRERGLSPRRGRSFRFSTGLGLLPYLLGSVFKCCLVSGILHEWTLCFKPPSPPSSEPCRSPTSASFVIMALYHQRLIDHVSYLFHIVSPPIGCHERRLVCRLCSRRCPECLDAAWHLEDSQEVVVEQGSLITHT